MSDESDLDFAARRLDAFAAQVSQAGRVIAEARSLGFVETPAGLVILPSDLKALRAAIADYDHAAARAAALNEGSR